jgi:hypothetical protein
MVHNIAQIALFLNRLFRNVFSQIVYFAISLGRVMLVGINHKLTANKTYQQYPRTNNMIFTGFQSSQYFFNNLMQK